MADELNVPTHRWYQARNHIKLPPNAVSKKWIYANGVALIDAWINSQPWGNPVPELFAAGEVGAWYDPSDLSTMFQDSAGTTPVTAVGQPVGLRLDKSKGLVLGPELVTNGGFSNGTTGWSGTSATLSEVSGRLRVTNSSASPGRGRQTIATVIGRTYAYRVDAFLGSASSLRFRVLDASLSAIPTSDSGALTQNSVGTVRYFTATTTTSTIELLCNDSVLGNYVEFDNISVKELPGNHASQSTPGSRAILRQVNGLYCLQYDGLDDFYVTSTITPGTDKVQVFAGVRKLSDANRASIVESGVNQPSSIRLEGPPFAGGQAYGFGSSGTVPTFNYTSSSGFAAPITSVLTGLGDIAGDLATLRVNGTQVAQSTADQGTGNYLAYPLYIGRRGGTSLPYNGYEFGLIVRFGPNLSTAQIASVEGWLNTRTGAY